MSPTPEIHAHVLLNLDDLGRHERAGVRRQYRQYRRALARHDANLLTIGFAAAYGATITVGAVSVEPSEPSAQDGGQP